MILASQSPRRRELLEDAGFGLRIVPAGIDESRHPGETPVALVGRLACEKAAASLAAAGGFGDDEALVAADTIVWDDAGDVLGKPADAEAARAMLRALSGAVHHVSTGVCLMAPSASGPRTRAFPDTTDVRFHELSDAEIDAYVASGEPMDKAGAYGIQGRGRLLVAGIRGDFYSVMGLPISRVVRELGSLLAEAAGPEASKQDLVADILKGRQS